MLFEWLVGRAGGQLGGFLRGAGAAGEPRAAVSALVLGATRRGSSAVAARLARPLAARRPPRAPLLPRPPGSAPPPRPPRPRARRVRRARAGSASPARRRARGLRASRGGPPPRACAQARLYSARMPPPSVATYAPAWCARARCSDGDRRNDGGGEAGHRLGGAREAGGGGWQAYARWEGGGPVCSSAPTAQSARTPTQTTATQRRAFVSSHRRRTRPRARRACAAGHGGGSQAEESEVEG